MAAFLAREEFYMLNILQTVLESFIIYWCCFLYPSLHKIWLPLKASKGETSTMNVLETCKSDLK